MVEALDFTDMDWKDGEDAEDGKPLDEGLRATNEVKLKIEGFHKDNTPIPKHLLFNESRFPQFGKIFPGQTIFIYVHDNEPGNPTLWILEGIENQDGGSKNIVMASIRKLEPEEEGCVVTRFSERSQIKSDFFGLWTQIEGVEQVFISEFLDVDAFIVEGVSGTSAPDSIRHGVMESLHTIIYRAEDTIPVRRIEPEEAV